MSLHAIGGGFVSGLHSLTLESRALTDDLESGTYIFRAIGVDTNGKPFVISRNVRVVR